MSLTDNILHPLRKTINVEQSSFLCMCSGRTPLPNLIFRTEAKLICSVYLSIIDYIYNRDYMYYIYHIII